MSTEHSNNRPWLALDLDGTVLNRDHQISPELLAAIQAIARDYLVLIVTGRHHVAALPYYQALGLETPMICCNGSYLYDVQQGAFIEPKPISQAIAERFLHQLLDAQLRPVLYNQDGMWFLQHNPPHYIRELVDWTLQFPAQHRPLVQACDDLAQKLESSQYAWKLVVEGDNLDPVSQDPWVAENLNGERSWHNRIDFAAPGNSKGNALTQFAQQQQLDLTQLTTVGDNHNDLSMFAISGRSIAMRNADPAVQKAATEVSAFDHHHPTGLAQRLQALFPTVN